MTLTIRSMTPFDVAPAADLLQRGDWGPRGARHAFFAFAVDLPTCRPIVAEADGEIVGTGVGTANGGVGWVGTIFVDAAQRGRGLGRALTEAVIGDLEEAGCSTLVLVATALGRPVYERLGFEAQGWYQTVEAPGLPGTTIPVPRTAPITARDLDEAAALDAIATGEDRSVLLRAVFASAGSDPGWALPAAASAAADTAADDAARLDAFLLRPVWGGGATIARSTDAALAVLDHRRRLVGPTRNVRAGLLTDNEEGLERLRAAGWQDGWRALRMARGAPLLWHPDMIWGQLNFALG
jgi:GNAT superfamily N-acetyltransferase